MDLSVDRSSEVPLGTQLAWKLQAAIAAGALSAGERLPGLRALAQEAGVNINTVRAVYARLEEQGLIASEQGRGTFVTERAAGTEALGRFAAQAAAEARNAGLDPREVATTLYAGFESAEPELRPEPTAPAPEASDARASESREYRAELRRQIAEYERQIAYYTRHSLGGPDGSGAAPARRRAGALLNASELEAIRDELDQRVAELRLTEQQTREEESELRQLERTVSELERQEDIHSSPRSARTTTSGPPRIVWQQGSLRWNG